MTYLGYKKMFIRGLCLITFLPNKKFLLRFSYQRHLWRVFLCTWHKFDFYWSWASLSFSWHFSSKLPFLCESQLFPHFKRHLFTYQPTAHKSVPLTFFVKIPMYPRIKPSSVEPTSRTFGWKPPDVPERIPSVTATAACRGGEPTAGEAVSVSLSFSSVRTRILRLPILWIVKWIPLRQSFQWKTPSTDGGHQLCQFLGGGSS